MKLSNSGEKYNKRVNFKAISSIINNSNKSFFKFVLDKNSIISLKALQEIEDITKNYKNTPIYCMPLGEDNSELKINDEAVISFCKKNGFIYSDRVHIRVWGNRIGV